METKFENSSILGNLTIKGFFFFFKRKKVFFKEKESEWGHIVEVERGRQHVTERLKSKRFRKSYINHYSRILITTLCANKKAKTKTSFWRQAVVNASTQSQRQNFFK